MPWRCPAQLSDAEARINLPPMYAMDAIVRRAPALQQTADGQAAAAYSSAVMARVGLQGEAAVSSTGEKVAAHA